MLTLTGLKAGLKAYTDAKSGPDYGAGSTVIMVRLPDGSLSEAYAVDAGLSPSGLRALILDTRPLP